jgi:hypothetical protein
VSPCYPTPDPNGRPDQVDARGNAEVPGVTPVGPSTLAEEKLLAGWQAATEPSGAPSRPMVTAGTRGAVDAVADHIIFGAVDQRAENPGAAPTRAEHLERHAAVERFVTDRRERQGR